ncbi:MAG: T9SS type A sorting domain-containing protein [Candidatus Cloacimonetes bacterium]|nr:T9SS type A sorting domain-containing protein [Candidatus Cloacimonadota bacterium]
MLKSSIIPDSSGKLTVIITILLFSATTLFSQIQWQEDGIPIRQGVNIEWSRAAAKLGDGCVVYVWSDTRRGDRDVWAQKVGIDGTLLWGAEAILVNGEMNRQEDPVVINTNDDGVVIAWVDFRNEDAGDIYAQKLDSDGNLLWNPAGVPLCLEPDIQISLNIVNDNNYGAYVIWLDYRNPGGVDIYGSHIDSSGIIATGWNENGNPIAAESGAQEGHTFWKDGQGGAILAWHDTRDADNENLYMQRISSDGTLLWNPGGNVLCDAPGKQSDVKIAPDGIGSFIFVWRDRRFDEAGDIFAQRVDINGNLQWSPDVEVYTGYGAQRNPRITESSDNGAIAAWEDSRNEPDPMYFDIYAQKLDINGNLSWEHESLPVCTALYHQLAPRLTSNNSGGAYIIWDDGRAGGHPNEDIYMQNVDASGGILWEVNGKVICDEVGEQASPLLRGHSSGKVYAVWSDKFGDIESNNISMQILDSAGNIFLEENGKIIYSGLCGDATNYHIFENGDNYIIIWEDRRSGNTQIFMQVLHNDGTVGLEENGQPITQDTGFNQEEIDAVIFPGINQVAVVWKENRLSGFNLIYAQSVDTDCNFLWSDSGLAVGYDIVELGEEKDPKISFEFVNNRSYNCYIGWSDCRNYMNPGIFGQKTQVQDGQLLWAEEGKEIVNITGEDELTDLVERFYIWETLCPWNIYVKLVDEDGNTANGWSDNGLTVCDAIRNQRNAKGLIIPQGLLIVWEDMRDILTIKDIYGQIVTYDGDILWEENGVPLVSLENDQFKPVFIYDNAIYLAWLDFRSGIDWQIYMQKYNDNGEQSWQENGIEIAEKASESAPSIAAIGDTILVTWEDCRVDTITDIYAQKLNSDGEIQWAEDLLVCGAIKCQSGPLTVTGDDNSAIIIWKDTRSSGKQDIYNIYAQKIQISDHGIDDEHTSDNNIKLYQNYPNPFSTSTTISFNLATSLRYATPRLAENARIRIYNIKGEFVRQFSIVNSQSSILWDGKDEAGKKLSNGIYFYKLYSDNFKSEIRKMVLLK